MLTYRQAFYKVARSLTKQGRPSVAPINPQSPDAFMRCLYRCPLPSENLVLKCGIGFLIDDDKYNFRMDEPEADLANIMHATEWSDLFDAQRDFFFDLQGCHDKAFNDWREEPSDPILNPHHTPWIVYLNRRLFEFAVKWNLVPADHYTIEQFVSDLNDDVAAWEHE